MDIVSFSQFGYAGEIVKVEADLRRGIPAINIVGLPDGAVREACERMRAAIRNSGLEFPRERILINLSPADLKKEGSSFDLPIALAVLLAASDDKTATIPVRIMVLGELELSGAVRPVRGVLSAVSRGAEEGIRWYIMPEANRAEAEILKTANVIGVTSLSEAIHRIRTLPPFTEGSAPPAPPGASPRMTDLEIFETAWPLLDETRGGYEDVRGQPKLVRGLEIAAAGGHNLVAYGPPGCGKTLALRKFPALLPDLDRETAVTVTRIHSIAGRLETTGQYDALARRPPFREPHQSASLEGMTGGGKNCRPGEISLAHGGVLFLDEAAQFRSSVLQALRTPLETGTVTVSRAGRTDTYPARFQLLMTLNPCPCGNYGSPGKVCTCMPEAIERYWKRMTAPLLDRIDIRVSLEEPDAESLAGTPGFSTAELREEIGRARKIQWERNGPQANRQDGLAWLNAHIDPGKIGEICRLERGVTAVFARSMEVARLSGRGGHSILKIARTVADLEGSDRIEEDHILEAVQFRRWSGMVPDFL